MSRNNESLNLFNKNKGRAQTPLPNFSTNSEDSFVQEKKEKNQKTLFDFIES